jgi:hypothetical protein
VRYAPLGISSVSILGLIVACLPVVGSKLVTKARLSPNFDTAKSLCEHIPTRITILEEDEEKLGIELEE